MKTLLRYSIAICLISAVSGCASPDDNKAGSGTSSSTSPTPPTAPTATEAAPLILKISTNYDQTDTFYEHKFVETGTTSCSATTATPNVTCTIEVPEGRLYYSSIRFSYSWRNDKCKLFVFTPYSYHASVNAAYVPPWADDAIDCSQGDLSPNNCWGGAAPYLVDGWPKNTGLIYLSDPSTSTPQTAEKTLKSAFSYKYRSNRLSASDLDPAKRGVAYDGTDLGVAGDEYMASSFQDYKWTCSDDWDDPIVYQIKLIIKDVDSDNGGIINNWKTWKEIP